jgi:hypothetical protein
MQQPRNLMPQEVPAGFANKLRAMRNTGDPRLNAVLAAARSNGWRTATLAEVLRPMNATACSKRIERAEPPTFATVARQALRNAAQKLTEIGRADIGATFLKLSNSDDPHAAVLTAVETLLNIQSEKRQLRTARSALAKALDYRQPAKPDISDIEIPVPPKREPAMMNGERLSADELAELREMQTVAAKVNGALPAGHEYRKVSERYSAKLNELISRRGFTPYYLARELGVTHRAITSRLERHGYREPCPSVRGTPSGIYRGHKIGEQAS